MKTSVLAVVLMVAGSASVRAAEQTFSDWIVDVSTDKERIYAATTNDSGSVLGEFCDLSTHKCSWLLAMDVACKDSVDLPILGNTASGAVQLNLTCGGQVDSGATYQYYFSNWKDVELLLKDSSLVGFAFPMKGGQFKVSRFSLTGRTDAVALAESVALTQPVTPPKTVQTGTGDTTL